MHPIHLLGIVTSFILLTTLRVGGDSLAGKTSRYLRPDLPPVSLQASVALCADIQFTSFHLHKVPEGLPSYTLRTGSGRTEGRDVYGVMRRVPLMVVFGIGTQLPRRPVMTGPPNPGGGGGCYLCPSKFAYAKVG